jgi:hypothetical protein
LSHQRALLVGLSSANHQIIIARRGRSVRRERKKEEWLRTRGNICMEAKVDWMVLVCVCSYLTLLAFVAGLTIAPDYL